MEPIQQPGLATNLLQVNEEPRCTQDGETTPHSSISVTRNAKFYLEDEMSIFVVSALHIVLGQFSEHPTRGYSPST